MSNIPWNWSESYQDYYYTVQYPDGHREHRWYKDQQGGHQRTDSFDPTAGKVSPTQGYASRATTQKHYSDAASYGASPSSAYATFGHRALYQDQEALPTNQNELPDLQSNLKSLSLTGSHTTEQEEGLEDEEEEEEYEDEAEDEEYGVHDHEDDSAKRQTYAHSPTTSSAAWQMAPSAYASSTTEDHRTTYNNQLVPSMDSNAAYAALHQGAYSFSNPPAASSFHAIHTLPTISQGHTLQPDHQAAYRNGLEHPGSAYLGSPTSEQVPSISSAMSPLPGNAIRGTPGNREPLDKTYRVRGRANEFFRRGKVFSVLFSEGLGDTAKPGDNENVTVIKHGEKVFSQIRRFVVVKERRGFCNACPIFSYGGRATTKSGVDAGAHGIIHTDNTKPRLVKGEKGIYKTPIRLVPESSRTKLSPQSRINYALVYPIQHNVKVKDHGWIHDDDMHLLIENWKEESLKEFES